MGYREGQQVVACKDFNVKGAQFVPFNDVGESTCLFPNLVDEGEMTKIMESNEETEKDETPLITEVQKSFYKHMIEARYEKILRSSFEKLNLRG